MVNKIYNTLKNYKPRALVYPYFVHTRVRVDVDVKIPRTRVNKLHFCGVSSLNEYLCFVLIKN